MSNMSRRFSCLLALSIPLLAGAGQAIDTSVPVTVTDLTNRVRLANGIVSVEIAKKSGDILSLMYRGAQVLDVPAYLDWQSGGYNHVDSGRFALKVDPSTNGGGMCEVAVVQDYPANSKSPFGVELHHVLRRGESGLYTFVVFQHPADAPAGGIGQSRMVLRVKDELFDFIKRQADGTWKRKGAPAADAEWIAEGWGGVKIRDGWLCVAPMPFDASGNPAGAPGSGRSHMVVWTRQAFPENFLLEFDMDSCDSTNGLAIVLFCATEKAGGDIFSTDLPTRRGDYKTYHSVALTNYTAAYWSRNNEQERQTNRLRRNPGMNLLASVPSRTAGASDLPVHLRLLKHRKRIAVEINGRCILACEDPAKPLGAGHIGLRSMEGVTRIRYDNFKVWHVVPADAR